MRAPDPLSPHLRFFTAASLRALLDRMGFDVRSLERTMYDVLADGMSIADVIHATPVANLDIAPSRIALAKERSSAR